tara:strand:+ start:691 stop:1248 length:558 start_codon:yes stop_codon:yes gene_type:complete
MAEQTFTSGQILTAAQMTTLQTNTGLNYISTTNFSGSTVAQIASVFTSSYTNYRAIIRIKGAATSSLYLRTLIGTTVQTDNLYSIQYGVRYSAGTLTASTRGDQYALFGAVAATYQSNYIVDFFSPQAASYTNINMTGTFQFTATDHDAVTISARNAVTTQLNGFELNSAGATNIDGSVVLYGYR